MNNDSFKNPFLSLSGEDYIALFSAVDHAAIVSMTDKKGDIIFVNDTFIEISKYSREELIGQNHRILKSGHQPDEIFVELWKTISGGKVWRGDIKNRAKDGSYYWVDSSIAPILDSSGKPVRYIAVRFLITEKKEMEDALLGKNKELEGINKTIISLFNKAEKKRLEAESLARQLERFKIALDGASDQIVITDTNGIVLYANSGLEKTTGFSLKEVLGKKVGTRELWGGRMDQEFYRNLWHTIKINKRPFSGELTNIKKDGTIYQALLRISPLMSKEGVLEFFVAIERDISKEKALDDAKSSFVSIASHQLRTPLVSIRWNSEMLLDKDFGALSDEQREFAKEVNDGAVRLHEVIDTLLALSRMEGGNMHMEAVDINLRSFVSDTLNNLAPLINEKKLSVITGIAENITVSLDIFMLREVINNLLANSIRYTDEGGKIVLGCKINEKETVCSVSDNGIGIPEDQKEKIFGKFFRADNAAHKVPDGSGLGLNLVRGFVEKWGGKVWFESKIGVGTTFYFTIPR